MKKQDAPKLSGLGKACSVFLFGNICAIGIMVYMVISGDHHSNWHQAFEHSEHSEHSYFPFSYVDYYIICNIIHIKTGGTG